MLEEPVIKHLEAQNGRNQIVLYGCEAHVCMRQTCFDLIERNYGVHLVVDACSSMNHHDRHVGIESMRDAGANLVTFQTVVFELARNYNHPKFKDCMNIVKDMPKNEEGKVEHIDLWYPQGRM